MPTVAPGSFRVLRSFWQSAEHRVEAGALVELSCGLLIAQLVAAQKVKPADEETAARVRAGAFPFPSLPASLRRRWVSPG